jgi:hypothetical protein
MFSARHDLTCNGGGSVKQIFSRCSFDEGGDVSRLGGLRGVVMMRR